MKSKSADLLSLIYKKRKGEALSNKEIQSFVASVHSKTPAPDYQIASLLAFIFMRGMNREEVAALTQAMRYSGTQFKYSGFPKGAHIIDKHSTGGVGDKITLPLAPLVAAAEESIFIPSIAGRGLGHTGGTVDKLESIPGFSCSQEPTRFYKILKKHQICFLAQTKNIVPADRVLYALRDVTGTVESIPLITASILSKKLSESLQYLLLDLKFGNGAFISDLEETKKLGESLLEVVRAAGLKADICMTRMNTPLGHYSGHHHEIHEALSILKGEGPTSSSELTHEFAKRMLISKGLDEKTALIKIKEAISSGRALQKFEDVIEAQGGSFKKFQRLRSKVKTLSLKAERSGFLDFETRQVGLSLVELGGGRKTKVDKIDPEVGFFHPFETGDSVEKGQEIFRIYYKSKSKLNNCLALLRPNIRIREEAFAKEPLIRQIWSS